MPFLLFSLLISVFAWAENPWDLALRNQMDSALQTLRAEPISADPRMVAQKRLDEAMLLDALGNLGDATQRVIESQSVIVDPDALFLHLGHIVYAIRRQDSLAISSAEKWITWLEKNAPGHPLRSELVAEMGFSKLGTQSTDSLCKRMDRLGLVRKWRMLGPFENVSNSGMARSLAPEKGLGWGGEISGKSAIPLVSRVIENENPDGWLRIDQIQSLPNAVNFFASEVILDQARRGILSFGVSGAYTLWVNGEKILDEPIFRNMGVEGVRVSLPLKKGSNAILVKIGHEGDLRSNFILRISDSLGRPFPLNVKVPAKAEGGARFSTTAKVETPSWTKVGGSVKDSLRLAMYFIQNDGFDQAFPILKQLEKGYPQSGWVHVLLGEFYARQEKHTLADQYYQKARRLAPQLANGWDYEFGRRISREDWSGAITWFETKPKSLKLVPDQIFSAIKAYLSLSRDTEAWGWVDTLQIRYASNPDAWMFASGVHGAIGDRKLSVQLLEQAGDRIFAMPGVFNELVERYKTHGNIEAAIALYRKKLNVISQSYADWMGLADLCMQAKDFDATLDAASAGLGINPHSYKLLLLQARAFEMRAKVGDSQSATESYRKALMVPGADYEVGERWLSLKNIPTLKDLRRKFSLDSLTAEGKAWKQGRTNHWQILLSQRALIWQEWGGIEQSVRLIVEVLTTKGVDHWKEQDAMEHFWSGDVQVDYAVTHKADGRTIEADASGTNMVFQGLEPGDKLELEVSCREQKDGPLAGQFWTWHFMAYSGPVLHNVFEVFTPSGWKDRYQIYQKDVPVKASESKLSGFVRKSWHREKVQGYQGESGMPSWGDVLPKVVISSLKNWESISTWYEMLSEGKTISSPELQTLADSLFTPSMTKKEKVKNVQDWIVRNIRYSHQLFRQSGYVPQDATKTLLTRIGDCKDMATIGKALLKLAGIRSDLVLVNTNDQERKATLPMDIFNHCILWVDLDGGRYIDFTANQNGWETLPRSDQLALSLRINPDKADSALAISLDLEGDFMRRESWDTLTKDGSLRRRMVTLRGGNFAASFREDYGQESLERIQDVSLASLQYSYPGVELFRLNPGELDSLQKDIRYESHYAIRNFAPPQKSAWVIPIPWSDQIEPNRLPGEKIRHYPWVIWKDWVFWGEFRQKTHLQLPSGLKVVSIPENQTLSSKAGQYTTRYQLTGSLLEMERVWVPKPIEVSPQEYPAVRRELEKLIAADHDYLVLQQ